MPNRLAGESSPYLLQHANNPVDWFPWGSEALGRAKAETKPIFLSIGYSACHWCHVMEHESFENPRIAALMNAGFVCIKVDREERPDLDHIYMNAVQSISGRGGWPMSVFLTPDLEPFFGGTYWPPTSGRGMPGFDQILHAVSDAWANRREQAVEQAGKLTEHLRQMSSLAADQAELSPDLLVQAARYLSRTADRRHGGFGGAPKFPHSLDLQVLLHVWRRTNEADLLDLAALALDKMAGGGIYDHLGGGFHRYSVDERWLVPHFEKMLYDNALLASAYVEGYQATKRDDYARVVRETCDYVLREMTDPAGGFRSTQDADSEGEEGKFYVWTPAEVERLLGPAAKAFCYVYDISPEGNFEGHNILNLPKPLDACAKILSREPSELARELAAGRQTLLAARIQRIPPGLDDKVLVSWNGLMIDALARAACALDEPRYLAAATKAADFILREMVGGDGRLWHAWRHGKAKFAAYLDDYGCLINSLVSLYEASFDERWIDQAARLMDVVLARFIDERGGGFFFTADDHERLIARHKDLQDGSVPSGNASVAMSLVRLAKFTGDKRYVEQAERTLASFAGLMEDHPMAAGQMLLALDLHLGPSPEMVFVAEAPSEFLSLALTTLRGVFRPNKTVACRTRLPADQYRSALLDPLFAGKEPGPNGTSLYVCENFACQAPLQARSAILSEATGTR